jgi:hypothetical protein
MVPSMNYEKTKKIRATHDAAPDSWVAFLQDCVSAVVKLEREETVRLAPLVKEAGIDGKNNKRGAQRENFESWFDQQAATRIAFYNEHKNPLLITFSEATTKSFGKWYDARCGLKVPGGVEQAIAKPLILARDALSGLAAERSNDKKLNALSARMNALASPLVPAATPAANDAMDAPVAKKRGRAARLRSSL